MTSKFRKILESIEDSSSSLYEARLKRRELTERPLYENASEFRGFTTSGSTLYMETGRGSQQIMDGPRVDEKALKKTLEKFSNVTYVNITRESNYGEPSVVIRVHFKSTKGDAAVEVDVGSDDIGYSLGINGRWGAWESHIW